MSVRADGKINKKNDETHLAYALKGLAHVGFAVSSHCVVYHIRTGTWHTFSYALNEVVRRKRRTTRLGSGTLARRLLILPSSSVLGRTKFGDTNAVEGVLCLNGLPPVSNSR
jgi:hypothetical protein